MNIATIAVSGVQAIAETYAVIPAGIVGATVTIRFTDQRWEGLTKIAVFQGCEARDVTITGETVVIPHETVARAEHTLRLGVYGVDTGNNLVIPTLWATVGVTRESADPSGDESLEATPAVWAQIAQRMTELEQAFESLTAAVKALDERIPKVEAGDEGAFVRVSNGELTLQKLTDVSEVEA